MDIAKVRKFCNDTAAQYGFELNCMIAANSRFTSTLGRVSYKNGSISKIEFSTRLLETSSLEDITDTILHELAHCFVFLETGENHGHDKVFKAMCARLGASGAATATIEKENGKHKYSIYCTDCGELIGVRDRRCNVINNPHEYSCGICSGKLKIVQNY